MSDNFKHNLVLGGLLTLIVIVYAIAIYFVLQYNSRIEARAAEAALLERKMTESCYNQNMVLVRTDAGPRCAPPSVLVNPN